MTLAQAQALAAIIKREVPEAATTVSPDIHPSGIYAETTYHIELHVPNVIQMSINSPAQWEERKHLIGKYDREK